MQFIEKSVIGLRSAIYRFKCPGKPDFLMFPMIHVGSQDFYREVCSRLKTCDLILVEGVGSTKGRFLTASYRIIKKINRMDLVLQSDALRSCDIETKMLNTDMSGSVFDSEWKGLPLWIRPLIIIGGPIYALYLYLYGTRNYIARHMELEDLPSPDEILDYDEDFEPLEELLIDKRDLCIIRNIEDVYSSHLHQQKTIGILYGARHMRNVSNYLMTKLKYRVSESEWLTVFDL